MPSSTRNFTIAEKRLLARLHDAHKDRLELKGGKGFVQLRKEAWSEIVYDYNNSLIMTSGVRTQDQLLKCWNNMKTRSRKDGHEIGDEEVTGDDQVTGNDRVPQSEMSEGGLPEDTGADPIPVKRRPRSKRKVNSTVNGDMLDFTMLVEDDHVDYDARGMARQEHKRKMQMLEEEHALRIEKLRWESKLARARFEREFGPSSDVVKVSKSSASVLTAAVQEIL